jgi:hypothetical protein
MKLIPKRKLGDNYSQEIFPIDSDQITPASIIAESLKDACITADKIESATITGTQIASGTITSDNIEDGTITGTDIDSATIAGGNIAAATITSSNIANGTITGTQIDNLTITAAKIANATITSDKIDSVTVDKLAAGTISSKAITLGVTADAGDTKIQAGKTDFTNTESGFILGIDDSDSDKPKFYIGDATTYLNWTGAAMAVKGEVTITTGSGIVNLSDAGNLAPRDSSDLITSSAYADFPESPEIGDLAYASDWEMLFRWDGSVWVLLVWKPIQMYVKTADQTVNNSTTFVDDNKFKFPAPANTLITLGVVVAAYDNIRLQSHADADIKFKWDYPEGTTIGWDIGATGPYDQTQTAVYPTSGAVENLAVPTDGLYATIAVGDTSGWLTLQWAQNAAHASDTTIFKDYTSATYTIYAVK